MSLLGTERFQENSMLKKYWAQKPNSLRDAVANLKKYLAVGRKSKTYTD